MNKRSRTEDEAFLIGLQIITLPGTYVAMIGIEHLDAKAACPT